MNGTPKHKVFVSYHHEDQHYKDQFTRMMEGDIVDRSVGDGDIDDRNAKTDTIRQRIRDEFIREATVTVVLVGRCTWQRKHVDWEIGSSLRDTPRNSRCGLLGIILPNHPDTSRWSNNPRLMPPRLADNCAGLYAFAQVQRWSNDSQRVRQWIHTAYLRRNQTPHPNNNRPQFANNRSGNCAMGWT